MLQSAEVGAENEVVQVLIHAEIQGPQLTHRTQRIWQLSQIATRELQHLHRHSATNISPDASPAPIRELQNPHPLQYQLPGRQCQKPGSFRVPSSVAKPCQSYPASSTTAWLALPVLVACANRSENPRFRQLGAV